MARSKKKPNKKTNSKKQSAHENTNLEHNADPENNYDESDATEENHENSTPNALITPKEYRYLNVFKGLIYNVLDNSYSTSEELDNAIKNDPFLQENLTKALELINNNPLSKLYDLEKFLAAYNNNIDLANQEIAKLAADNKYSSFQALLTRLGLSEESVRSLEDIGYDLFARNIHSIYTNNSILTILRYYIVSKIVNNLIKFNIENLTLFLLSVVSDNKVIIRPEETLITLSSAQLKQIRSSMNTEEKSILTEWARVNTDAKIFNELISGKKNLEASILRILNQITRTYPVLSLQSLLITTANFAVFFAIDINFQELLKKLSLKNLSHEDGLDVIKLFHNAILSSNKAVIEFMLENRLLNTYADIELLELIGLFLNRSNQECTKILLNYILSESQNLNFDILKIGKFLKPNQLERLQEVLKLILADSENGILSIINIDELITDESYKQEAHVFLRSLMLLFASYSEELISKKLEEMKQKNFLIFEGFYALLIHMESIRPTLINAYSPYLIEIIIKYIQKKDAKLGYVFSVIDIITRTQLELANNIIARLFQEKLINLDFLIYLLSSPFTEVMKNQPLLDIAINSAPPVVHCIDSVAAVLKNIANIQNFDEQYIAKNHERIRKFLAENNIDTAEFTQLNKMLKYAEKQQKKKLKRALKLEETKNQEESTHELAALEKTTNDDNKELEGSSKEEKEETTQKILKSDTENEALVLINPSTYELQYQELLARELALKNQEAKINEEHALRLKQIEAREKEIDEKYNLLKERELALEQKAAKINQANQLQQQELKDHTRKIRIEIEQQRLEREKHEKSAKATAEEADARSRVLLEELKETSSQLKIAKQQREQQLTEINNKLLIIEERENLVERREITAGEREKEIANYRPPRPEIFIKQTTIEKVIYHTTYLDFYGRICSTTSYAEPDKITTSTIRENNGRHNARNGKGQHNNNNNKLSDSVTSASLDPKTLKEQQAKQVDLALKKLKINAYITDEEKDDYEYSMKQTKENSENHFAKVATENITNYQDTKSDIDFIHHSSSYHPILMNGVGSNFFQVEHHFPEVNLYAY